MRKRPFRELQYAMFAYTLTTAHPALIVAPRLGKNLPTIRRVQLYRPLAKRLKVLIIAPNSAIGSWEKELAAEGEVNVYLIEGDKEARDAVLHKGIFRYGTNRDWYIVNSKGLIHNPELASISWDCVILDESTDAKNINSQFTKFILKNFRDVPHRWILSGTPEPENQLELWTQLAFLDGSAFGFKTFWAFRHHWFTPNHFKDKWTAKPGTQEKIKEYMAKRCYFLQKEDAGIVINKTDTLIPVTMPPTIRKQYDECEKNYELGGEQTIWATTKHIWLRKLCGGLIDDKMVWEGKYFVLQSLIKSLGEDEKIVVWFNYNDELKEVQNRLDKVFKKVCSITGETSRPTREILRKAWEGGFYRILLLQQAIAQTGMDLSAGRVSVYYSRNPGSLSNLQTAERIVNISKLDRKLNFISIVVKDTVDEDSHYVVSEKKWRSEKDLSRALVERIRRRLQFSGGKKCS